MATFTKQMAAIAVVALVAAPAMADPVELYCSGADVYDTGRSKEVEVIIDAAAKTMALDGEKGTLEVDGVDYVGKGTAKSGGIDFEWTVHIDRQTLKFRLKQKYYMGGMPNWNNYLGSCKKLDYQI